MKPARGKSSSYIPARISDSAELPELRTLTRLNLDMVALSMTSLRSDLEGMISAAGASVGGGSLSGAGTAGRLAYWTDADSIAPVANLSDWIAGDTGVIITDDGDGTITISVTAAALGDAVLLAPASSARNVVQPTGNFIPLTLRGHSTQATNLLQLENSSSVSLAAFTADGNLSLSRTDNSNPVSVAIANGGASDAQITMTAGSTWSFGPDNSDSDSMVYSLASTLGTNNRFRLGTSGQAHFGNAITSNTGSFQARYNFASNSRVIFRFENAGTNGAENHSIVLVAVPLSSTSSGCPVTLFRRGGEGSMEWACYSRSDGPLRWKYNNSGSGMAYDTTSLMALDTSGSLSLTGGNLNVTRSDNSTPVSLSLVNNGTHDAQITMTAGSTWAFGIDNSASDSLVFCTGSALGTNNRLVLATDGTLQLFNSIILPTSGGTKIGTSTSQLLAFWDATPVDQPAHIADPAGGATVDAEARAVAAAILDLLEEVGLMAA